MVYEWQYVVNKTTTPTSKTMIKIKKTCDNCYEKKPLAPWRNLLVCKECMQDTQMLENR